MTMLEEQLLVEKAKTDKEAFVRLYDFYYPKIFGYVFRRTLDLEKTKDITSETFLRAYQNIGRFQWKNIPFSSWLFRIATNVMNLADRKKKYKPASLNQLTERNLLDIVDPESLEAEKMEAERVLSQHSDFLLIQQKFVLLSIKYQEVIALRYFEEKSVKEIAEIVRKNEGTVRSLLSRGIDKLRLLL
jgi:RNA polymerase sigma-70 factor (ECF subfamily)